MKAAKHRVREAFRAMVFGRDKHKCRVCGLPGVDAHHITDRHLMPNGGYVLENGITLCGACHIEAEKHHTNAKDASEKYSPDALYHLIKSNAVQARVESQRQK